MEFFFAAKGELNTDAGLSGIIPWSSIYAYGQAYGLDTEEFDRLVRNIRAMEKGGKDAEEDEKPRDEPAKGEGETTKKPGGT